MEGLAETTEPHHASLGVCSPVTQYSIPRYHNSIHGAAHEHGLPEDSVTTQAKGHLPEADRDSPQISPK